MKCFVCLNFQFLFFDFRRIKKLFVLIRSKKNEKRSKKTLYFSSASLRSSSSWISSKSWLGAKYLVFDCFSLFFVFQLNNFLFSTWIQIKNAKTIESKKIQKKKNRIKLLLKRLLTLIQQNTLKRFFGTRIKNLFWGAPLVLLCFMNLKFKPLKILNFLFFRFSCRNWKNT